MAILLNVECEKGHKTKYVTNDKEESLILCPHSDNGNICKSPCKIINDGEVLNGELNTPIPEDVMITKFKDHYRGESIKRKPQFCIPDWYVSTDNVIAIRKLDFNVDDITRDITFTKISTLNIETNQDYTLDKSKLFGYSGYLISEVLLIFDNKCTVWIPDDVFPGYAISYNGNYIIIFSPKTGTIEGVERFLMFEKETQSTFEDDDVW